MRRLIALALAASCLAPAAAQSPVMPVPLTGTAAGLQTVASSSSSGGVIVSGPASFYGVTITLIGGQGPGFVMLFDSTTVPADGAVTPMRCLYVDGGPRTTTFGSSGFPLSVIRGLTWAFSTGANCQTKVAATANFVGISYKQQTR